MKMPEDVANTAKSIAFLIEEMVEDEAIRSITASAETAINTMVQKATEKLDDTIKRNVEVINAMVTRQGEVTIEAEKMAEHLRTSLTQLSNTPTANISAATQSYRDVLAGPFTTLNPTNAASMKIMNRMAIQSRQVLIKPDATAAAANQSRTPEQLKEIKTKVTEIIAKLTKPENLDASPHAVSITRGGLILVEMGNPEAANWLQTDEITKQFIQEFDPNAAVKRRNFPIILKFVPIEWNPDSQDELRDLETRHGLEANTITSAAWIKDPTKCRTAQVVANVKLMCSSPSTANKIIIGPTYLGGRAISAHKDIKEPSVCGKCQHYGHFVAECRETKDTCRQCGNDHHTNTCTERNSVKCIPCGSTDHSTNDRTCPEYAKRMQTLEQKSPEYLKPFYLTTEQWTWDDNAAPPFQDTQSSFPVINLSQQTTVPSQARAARPPNAPPTNSLTNDTDTRIHPERRNPGQRNSYPHNRQGNFRQTTLPFQNRRQRTFREQSPNMIPIITRNNGSHLYPASTATTPPVTMTPDTNLPSSTPTNPIPPTPAATANTATDTITHSIVQ